MNQTVADARAGGGKGKRRNMMPIDERRFGVEGEYLPVNHFTVP